MITENELRAVELSPTKKDYYQIWNEIIDLADKISPNWSPAATNESDPGIILLKVLTAVADKLNYNIDKNILEAFMPSATQEESMRKLCDMLGYTMQYYRAASCNVSISFKATDSLTMDNFANGIYFPRFVNIKDQEEQINYVTTEAFTLSAITPSYKVPAIEGELVECESNDDNIITMLQLDDHNRYILPESNIAQNGIFITNIDDSLESELWLQVDNLNTHGLKSKIFKFNYDSKLGRPYIQFPEDMSQLIGDGIRIKYVRTNGVYGNIDARKLSKLIVPSLWSTANADDSITKLTTDNFSVINASSTKNGQNPEGIESAYNNYKKTIGTFDTLVTCRDYMNRIYQMTYSNTNTTPLVSNIIVSDLRDDINKAHTLCSFDDYGICYKHAIDANTIDPITHFDLLLYPFKTVDAVTSADSYKDTFIYTKENINLIEQQLEENKTISHNIKTPSTGSTNDITCIKNYLKLNARISTVRKITSTEAADILNKIYIALYESFNARQLDFGEAIPYESIIKVISNADTRIRDIYLDTPTLATSICLADGTEFTLASFTNDVPIAKETKKAIYNKLVLKNILAGKLAAFSYDTDFVHKYDEAPVTVANLDNTKKISTITSSLTINALSPNSLEDDGITLAANEVVQFYAPNLKTTITYPAYVNYYFVCNNKSEGEQATAAKMITLNDYLLLPNPVTNTEILWETLAKALYAHDSHFLQDTEASDFASAKEKYENNLFELIGGDSITVKWVGNAEESTAAKWYYISVTGDRLNSFMLALWAKDNNSYSGIYKDGLYITAFNEDATKFNAFARDYGMDLPLFYKGKVDLRNNIGYLIDENLVSYSRVTKALNTSDPDNDKFKNYYIPDYRTKTLNNYGLGQNSTIVNLQANSEYRLKDGESLLLEWTEQSDDGSTKVSKTAYYIKDTIIKPNFNLVDSATLHSSKSYSKTNLPTSITDRYDIPGMFTLDTDQQIEIRSVVRVNLAGNHSYLYWITNETMHPDTTSTSSTQASDPVDTFLASGASRILKKDEYFFYTDSKQLELVYYGEGTQLVNNTGKALTRKIKDESNIEKILKDGIKAIPWSLFDLGKELTKEEKAANPSGIYNNTRGIDAIEYQYINLTENDTLLTINGRNDYSLSKIATPITNPLATTYKFANSSEVQHLPELNLNNTMKWNAVTKLEFNLDSDIGQKIRKTAEVEDKFEVKYVDTAVSDAIILPGTNEKLLVKSNIALKSSYDVIDVKNIEDSLKIADDEVLVKLNIVEENNILLPNDTQVILENSDLNFTTVSLDAFGKTQPADTKIFDLNINIPEVEDEFGLVALYVNGLTTYGSGSDGKESITLATYSDTEEEPTATKGISEYNTNTPADYSYTIASNGFIVIKLEQATKMLRVSAKLVKDTKAIIKFGRLSLVKGINPILSYHGGLDQLLTDIRTTLGSTEKFYYNTPIFNDRAISANTDETFVNCPALWYDANNIANKFVISEIDTAALEDGIIFNRMSLVQE